MLLFSGLNQMMEDSLTPLNTAYLKYWPIHQKRVSPEEEAIAVQRAADAMSELLFSTENPAAPVARGRAARLQPPQKKD